MKKFMKAIAVALAAVACVSAFASIGVFADGETTPTVEFIYKENFENMFLKVPEKADSAGLWCANDYADTAEVVDDETTGRRVLNVDCKSADDTVAAFIDFQMWSDPDIVAISENFTLSMNVKLLGEWNNSQSNFWVFRYYKAAEAEQLSMNAHPYFKIVGGKFTMVTDNGEVSSDVDIFNEYVFIDWAFTKTDSAFTSVTCYVNGEVLGTKTFSGAGLTAIDQFRMFYTCQEGQGVSIDSYAFTKGNQTLYGVEIPDNPVVRPPERVPAAPAVSEEEKVEMEYHYLETFDGLEEVNISNAAGDIRAANGFWLNTNGEEKYTLTDEGSLSWGGAEFLDLQFYQLNKYRVKEDFVFSVKFKPLSQGMSGHFLSQIRRDSNGDWTNYGVIQFDKGCIKIGEVNYGELPVDEWTLLEVAFDYDDEKSEFVSYTLMINGNELATFELDSALVLTQIKHFRLFRVMKNMSFEIDDLAIISGDKSAIYAKPVEEEAPPADDGNGEGENNGENQTPDDGSNNETEPPKTDTAPVTGDTAEVEEEKGCISSVSVGAIALVSAIGVAGVALLRKKED